jgi:hypothetical protein
MYRIIDSRGSGKTSRLMLLAKETGSAIACFNPIAMREKAYAYGITGIDFISYSDLFNGKCENQNVMIDELEAFVKSYIDCKLTGYSLSNED